MKINQKVALAILYEEAAKAVEGNVDPAWIEKFRMFSELSESAKVRTHIAFLGTSLLARAVDPTADLYEIQPTHAKDNGDAYSARTLCHEVLVPFAADVGLSLGVNGREPLNNQPYLKMHRFDENVVVSRRAKDVLKYLCELVKELSEMRVSDHARVALRAFIFVRKQYQKTYAINEDHAYISPSTLLGGIVRFVKESSEGGKRAQAVVAGLMDVYAGENSVESGKINDPSRHYPGDVAVRSSAEDQSWEKAIEVRDKPVSREQAQIFGKLCVEKGVRDAAIVMVAAKQPVLDQSSMQLWADQFGIGLTLFHGWTEFVNQVLYWCSEPRHEASNLAARCIESRLMAVEAEADSIPRWWSCLNAEKSSQEPPSLQLNLEDTRRPC